MEKNIIKNNKELLDRILKNGVLPLAFIGDSVHTLFVREKCLEKQTDKMENYHAQASKYCKASCQARVLKTLLPSLSEEERQIARRGRNAKPKHSAKNASSADYSYATAFEVLIGYLYLKGDANRLEEILEFSVSDVLD